MIDLDAFRAAVQAWLQENAPRYQHVDPTDLAALRDFRKALSDAGFLGITLDAAYGGYALTAEHQRVFSEEAGRHPLPPIEDPVTVGICAPTLLDFGTEEQKKRHVARMVTGQETWTQLLSEPGAGSDLAGLQTRAARDGNEYVVSGQKVWTSGAQHCDYALCVARTDPDVPKHEGLSMFIVDLRSSGVTIRPLKQMTGDSHFNEVFLDDVRLPETSLVGGENDGWRVLTSMLTHERLALGAGTSAGGSGQGWAKPAVGTYIELARRKGSNTDPVVRQELAKLYVSERILMLLGQKLRDELAAGFAVGARGSVAKLAVAQLARQSANLGTAIEGPASQAWEPLDPAGADLATAVCFAPMRSIAGGTSEIQRNTIGERVLGLPKDVQVDRGVPFRDSLQNPTSR